MKKLIAVIMTVAMFTGVLSGCGGEKPAPVQSENTPATSTSVQPEPSSDEQVPPAAVPNVSEEEKNLTEFKSDFGYAISYDEDSFDYRRTEGYDEFILKSDAADKPFVFVSVSYVEAEFVDQMETTALGAAPESCTIGQAQTQAQCSETEEAWDGGKVIHKTYVYPLDSGDALLIETQWYTEQANDPFAAMLLEMVNSIKL